MGKRKPILEEVQTELLTLSARRCCFCYGIRGDLEEKKGQIAHVNRDPSDIRLENLVWLCFDHHDEYDTRTSQSKGYTSSELKTYRERLYILIKQQSAKIKLTYATMPLRSRLRELLYTINPEILHRLDEGQNQIEAMISQPNLLSMQKLQNESGFEDLIRISPTGSVILGGFGNRIGNAINDVLEGGMLQGFLLDISPKLRERF